MLGIEKGSEDSGRHTRKVGPGKKKAENVPWKGSRDTTPTGKACASECGAPTFWELTGRSRQPGLAVGGDGDRRVPEEQRPGTGNQMEVSRVP